MQVRYRAALRPDRANNLGEQGRTGKSARRARASGSQRTLALAQLRQQPLELGLDLLQRELASRILEADLDLGGVLAIIEQPAPRPRDREAPRVQEILDLQQQLDLLGPVHAVAGSVLLRTQHAELRLPVAQDVRLHAHHVADFADRSVQLSLGFGLGFDRHVPSLSAPRLRRRRGPASEPRATDDSRVHASRFRSLDISACNAVSGLTPSNSIAHTCSVIGSSRPRERPRSRAARAVCTPSATITISASVRSSVAPRPSASPTWRFRLCRLVAVAIRSPMPASPKNVSRRPPIAVPSRAISASPRVSNAAFVLSPNPRPSPTPAAIAITFLSAAANSQPATSSLRYTRSRSVEHACCTARALDSSLEAATTDVGIPRATSSAWLGPVRTTGAGPPSTAARIDESRSWVLAASPFDALTHRLRHFVAATASATPRIDW